MLFFFYVRQRNASLLIKNKHTRTLVHFDINLFRKNLFIIITLHQNINGQRSVFMCCNYMVGILAWRTLAKRESSSVHWLLFFDRFVWWLSRG